MFNLVHNAKVEVSKGFTNHGATTASVMVNDRFSHTFKASSRISKHLHMMTPTDLSKQLSGGSFFFVDDKLIDFRDSSYNGFVHTDDSVNHLMDTIGFEDIDNTSRVLGVRGRRSRLLSKSDTDDDVESTIRLRKQWDVAGFKVPGYADGGEMESHLFYQWNPFVSHVRATYELLRLICENGAVGIAPIFNAKIPLVNRWQEHLDMATDQIQRVISHKTSNRMISMKDERASLYDCLNTTSHIQARVSSEEIASTEFQQLRNILNIVNPQIHLDEVYNQHVFDNSTLAKQLPSHLTAMDLYNIVTEVRTHTTETSKSRNTALDGLANALLFGEGFSEFDSSVDRCSTSPKISSFSDSETAFFGMVN